ncbi:sister chromatid cohesion protein DCC1 isoform X2 [Prorops nasuta]|uniref:sister chromatid cohesion protein DCC1 isoform X2 n=1 Tax=Prorops nasuta TaxID=863751 RepID=UPI0034CEA28F
MTIQEDITEALKSAGVKEVSLHNVSQVLYYLPNEEANQDCRLLELDDQLLEMVEKGESFTFQGRVDETAVLCTKNRTYEVREAETSNSLLLVPDFKFSSQSNINDSSRILEHKDVKGIFYKYYEIRECKPQLPKLLTLLDPSSFKGQEYESSIDSAALFDWDKLRNEIQASEAELLQALDDYLIININGYFRLISFECEARSVTLMLDLLDENSWEVDEVDREITYDALKNLIIKPVLDTLFKKYAEVSEKKKDDGSPLYKYNEIKTCKLLAKVLLAASPVTEYKQFMESWHIGTPDKMTPKDEYLSGIALVIWNKKLSRKEVISYPETSLPRDITARFHALFKVKSKWTVQEITPYIINLTTSKMNVQALLTKYARCSMSNGVKLYSSKYDN